MATGAKGEGQGSLHLPQWWETLAGVRGDWGVSANYLVVNVRSNGTVETTPRRLRRETVITGQTITKVMF
jgi:hypothetical protein